MLMAPGSHVAGDAFVLLVRMQRDPERAKAFAPVTDLLRKYDGFGLHKSMHTGHGPVPKLAVAVLQYMTLF